MYNVQCTCTCTCMLVQCSYSYVPFKQGLKISCPEEISWNNKWISDNDLNALTEKIGKNQYSEYLKNILKNNEV